MHAAAVDTTSQTHPSEDRIPGNLLRDVLIATASTTKQVFRSKGNDQPLNPNFRPLSPLRRVFRKSGCLIRERCSKARRPLFVMQSVARPERRWLNAERAQVDVSLAAMVNLV